MIAAFHFSFPCRFKHLDGQGLRSRERKRINPNQWRALLQLSKGHFTRSRDTFNHNHNHNHNRHILSSKLQFIMLIQPWLLNSSRSCKASTMRTRIPTRHSSILSSMKAPVARSYILRTHSISEHRNLNRALQRFEQTRCTLRAVSKPMSSSTKPDSLESLRLIRHYPVNLTFPMGYNTNKTCFRRRIRMVVRKEGTLAT